MQKIANPKKISFDSGQDPNQGIITIEPLFPGYGMTLGNSLRRVLLSSLEGAAVTGVKIKGASHEFMALPNIKEDVLEMVLNFKQIRMKVFTEEEIKLTLNVSGKKTVTAKDIEKNSDVEIINKDLVLANITDKDGALEAEITVKRGRGYKMAEGSKRENKEVGFLEVDSIFSPVNLVSIKVENARVGKMTNWDKLVLDVKTDGTLSPEEAFNKATEILVDQLSALLPGGLKEEEPLAEEKDDEEIDEEAKEKEEEKQEEAESEEKEEKKTKKAKTGKKTKK